MYRIEIVANKSVEEDITQSLEQYVPGILYTTWPETNFLLISYIEDEELPAVRAVIAAVKERFKGEGIKYFVLKGED